LHLNQPLAVVIAACSFLFHAPAWSAAPTSAPAAIDSHVRTAMAGAQVQGLALAFIDEGKLAFTASWGGMPWSWEYGPNIRLVPGKGMPAP
jgi:CubicO group peptidase (beta-lactamase class C family)